jgi:polysaccharide biosynthesis transport protein
VEVVDRASEPSVRIESGGPALLTVVGGALGLIVGLLVGFAREALDRRLRTARDLHREIGAPILGRIPASAFGKSWRASAPGAGEIDPDFESFRALRSNLTYLSAPDGSPVRSVLVTSAAPDEGKTTVSVGLAAAAAQVGQNVLLLEVDLRRPSLAAMLGIAQAPGLSEYLAETAEPRSVVQAVPVAPLVAGGQAPSVQSGARFACITAGALRSDGARLLSSERLATAITELREAYDLVVLDGSPLLAAADSMDLIRHADTVLVCARLQSTKRDQVRALRSVIDNLGPVQIGAVATGLSRKGPDAYEYYYGY